MNPGRSYGGIHSLFQPRDCRVEDCPGASGHRQTRGDPQGPVSTEKGVGPSQWLLLAGYSLVVEYVMFHL